MKDHLHQALGQPGVWQSDFDSGALRSWGVGLVTVRSDTRMTTQAFGRCLTKGRCGGQGT